MRQAEENEIIRLTMAMREFKPLELYKGTNIQILDKKDVLDGMYSWADQVIVAKNDTRKQTNYKIRKMLYNIDTPLPIEGDKIVCLRNDWDHPSGAGEIMVNGSLGYIQNIDIQNSKYTNKIILADFIPEEYTDEELQFVPQDVIFRNIKMDYKLFNEGEPTVNKDNWKKIPPPFKPLEFDYGYCITCWKAQGSEYNKVLAFEESFPFKKEDHYKYLYTAATRAKEKLVLIRNN
jgi:exodeoxyribonuclease-5